MDIDKIKKDKERDQKKIKSIDNTTAKEKEQGEINRIIDCEISGKPIEVDHTICNGKIFFTLREITSKMALRCEGLIFREPVIGTIPSITNQISVAAYLAKYNDKDFVASQGNKFEQEEGLKERIEFVSKMKFNIRNIILEKKGEFQELLKKAFSSDNLKNL